MYKVLHYVKLDVQNVRIIVRNILLKTYKSSGDMGFLDQVQDGRRFTHTTLTSLTLHCYKSS